jgi:Ferritin-like domain
VASTVRDSEDFHVSVLGDLLKQLGAAPDPIPKFDFGPAFASESNFLTLARTLEDTGVSAYNGAAPQLQDPDVLDAAGRIVQVEARHAAMFRFLLDERIAPEPFDTPLAADQVTSRVKPYIRG